MAPTSVVIGTFEAMDMLCVRAPRAIILLDEALTMMTNADRPVVSALKGVGLNLVSFLSKVLYLLQDGVIVELQAHDQHALQVISEQKVNNVQMAV